LFEAVGGHGAGVVLFHAWWGLNDAVLDFAAKLAADGYTVLAPDLYGTGEVAATIEDAERLSSAAEGDDGGVAVEQAALGAADWLISRTGGPICVVGFSFGAAYSLWLAKKRPDDVRAVVVYYGTMNPVGGSAAVLGHFAEDDPYEPAGNVDGLKNELAEQGRDAEIHVYPGTHHWFAEPDRPEYVAAAAGLAWQRTVDFLGRHTKA
jgi:carboxymethylenebutenolidase